MSDETTESPTPEAEANARIKELQNQIINLQKEIRSTQGRFANRDPKLSRLIKKENTDLKARIEILEIALVGLLQDSFNSRTVEDENLQYEILRDAAVEYCKKANIDPEIWKNLVS